MMSEIEKIILTAKPWQVFVFIVALFIASESFNSIFIQSLCGTVFYLWLYIVSNNLLKKNSFSDKTFRYLKVSFLCFGIFGVLLVACTELKFEVNYYFVFMILLGLCCFIFFYILILTAQLLITIYNKRLAKFDEYSGYFLSFLGFFIGGFYPIQKKLREIFLDEAELPK